MFFLQFEVDMFDGKAPPELRSASHYPPLVTSDSDFMDRKGPNKEGTNLVEYRKMDEREPGGAETNKTRANLFTNPKGQVPRANTFEGFSRETENPCQILQSLPSNTFGPVTTYYNEHAPNEMGLDYTQQFM